MRRKKFEKNVEYSIDLSGKEPEFYMGIGFENLEKCLLSIAHRQLSNRGSGLIRHTGNPIGIREINGIQLKGVYLEDRDNARLYHDTYLEHIHFQGLDRLDEGRDFIMISNGNLGNNFWHVAWQGRFRVEDRMYFLKGEPIDQELFFRRTYSAFLVPKKGKPKIGNVNLVLNRDWSEPCVPECFQDVLDEQGNDLTEEVDWLTSGQQIVRDRGVVPIEEIIEQFYDIKHVFDLRDWGPSKEQDIRIMNKIHGGYPDSFKANMLAELRSGRKRAGYYHSTLGVDEQGIVLYHSFGEIEEIAKRLVDKGVKDSIILDQGGSVGAYASWIHPNGGYISSSSYFRPNRISTIAFVLNLNE